MSEEIDKEILVHLRQLKRVVYWVGFLLFVLAVPTFYQGFSRASSEAAPSWERVRVWVGRQDFPMALSMAQTLVTRQPDYYWGHSYLAHIYLATGDVTNAEKEYSRAYDLFPSEENDKNLAAVRKRIAAGHDFKLQSK